MNIVELPDLILVHVLKLLDFQSKKHLWRTCCRFRELLQSRKVMSSFKLGKSEIYSGGFIDKLSCCASELELYCTFMVNGHIYDTFRLFDSVTLLDLSLTKMYLLDVHELLPALQSLKKLKVNFDWLYINKDIDNFDFRMQRCQSNVRRLEHVHFVINSSQMLECDHILQVLQLCDSLRTLYIDVRMRKNRHHLHIHLNCTQPIPSSLQLLTISHDIMSSMPNVHLKRKFLNASWKEISFAPGKRHNPKFKISECLQDFLPFVKSSEIHPPVFERLYNPELLLDHADLFHTISENLCKHMITKICENMLPSRHLSDHIYELCPLALPIVQIYDNSIVHLFSLKEVTQPKRYLRVSVIFCEKHNQGAVSHKLHVEVDSASAQLRHLSCLELVNVSISGNFGKFFGQCDSLHTLKLENSYCNAGYTDIVQNLKILPHLRNFQCADVTIPADQLMKECACCCKLENIAVYLHGKVPCPESWSILICCDYPLTSLQIQAKDEDVLTYEDLRVKVDTANLNRQNHNKIVFDVNEFCLGTFINLITLKDFIMATEL